MVSESDVVWDDSRDWVMCLWSVYAHYFPLKVCSALRRGSGSLASALLDCGHVVRVPSALFGPRGRRAPIGCYKCWLRACGTTLAETCWHVMPCSFCGRGHPPEAACMRPHPLGPE